MIYAMTLMLAFVSEICEIGLMTIEMSEVVWKKERLEDLASSITKLRNSNTNWKSSNIIKTHATQL